MNAEIMSEKWMCLPVKQVQVDTSTGQRLQLHFAASLLQLRGSQLAAVPLLDADSADCLCFNGEVFGGLNVPEGHNDGVVLFQALRQAPGGSETNAGIKAPTHNGPANQHPLLHRYQTARSAPPDPCLWLLLLSTMSTQVIWCRRF